MIDSLVAAGAAKGKGEYETTKDFDLRIKALSSRYGQLVFLVPEKTTASFEYDADAGEMTVALSAEAEIDGMGYLLHSGNHHKLWSRPSSANDAQSP